MRDKTSRLAIGIIFGCVTLVFIIILIVGLFNAVRAW